MPAAGRVSGVGQSHKPRPARDPESELRTGTQLTRQGRFSDAIPHLLAARAGAGDQYAVKFNLALCYVATRQPKVAIPVLASLQKGGTNTAAVWNLLAQAYVGDGQSDKALEAVKRAAALSPGDEKLYSFVADACTDARNNRLGLKVVELGLQSVPDSARLHYERAVFLTGLDRFDLAKNDFLTASRLASGTGIGYLAAAHEKLLEGDSAETIRIARDAIAKGKANYILRSLLGEALIQSGVDVGEPGFAEAEGTLQESITERPSYSRSRISLAKLYLMGDRVDEAISQLETARTLDPENPAVYSYLAAAFRRKGDLSQAREALAVLARLNNEQVTSIREEGATNGEHRGNVAKVRNQ
ncbi:MAG TPA: tetratricopeptide repeat protein [Candidatus Limnocylindrales bacterium]|nr:tetratricopeptide repeat protein [Candidatus Limnocylindrales bacterium]